VNVSVIGLGKLGLPIAVAMSNAGIDVVGLDRDEDLLRRLREPTFVSGEPGVHFGTLKPIQLTSEYRVAIGNSDLTLVIVPTPSDSNDQFSNDFVLNACSNIGRELGCKPGGHTVVIVSTVMPGSIDGPILEALKDGSREKVFNLLYNPQFVALGSVIRDFTTPDLVLIGQSKKSPVAPLLAMYDKVLHNLPQIAVTETVNAEVAKLALNCAVSAKITLANVLARVIERIPGADVDTVTDIIGCDHRVGKGYMRAAVNYGGPCFPRDVSAMATIDPTDFFGMVAQINRNSIDRFCFEVARALPSNTDRLGILGMSYKVGSDVTDEALGAKLATVFRSGGREVHDDYSEDPCEVVRKSDVIVVALDDPRYKQIPDEVWSPPITDQKIVFDVWRLLPYLSKVRGIDYRPVGIGPR